MGDGKTTCRICSRPIGQCGACSEAGTDADNAECYKVALSTATARAEAAERAIQLGQSSWPQTVAALEEALSTFPAGRSFLSRWTAAERALAESRALLERATRFVLDDAVVDLMRDGRWLVIYSSGRTITENTRDEALAALAAFRAKEGK